MFIFNKRAQRSGSIMNWNNNGNNNADISYEKMRTLLSTLNSTESIYSFFKGLGYEKAGDNVRFFDKTYKQEFELPKDEAQKVESIHPVISFGRKEGGFKAEINVFFVKVKSVSNSLLRSLNKYFSNKPYKFLLIVTKDFDEITFVLPDVIITEEGKSKVKLTKLSVEKKNPYRTDIEVLSGLAYAGEKSSRELWRKWRDAFKLEKVTESFFADYKEIFLNLRKAIIAQKIQTKDAHEFSLQLLNRIMFIYFISKKKWLGTNPKFMKWLWHDKYLQACTMNPAIKDSFYSVWLKTIFFEAFNNEFKGNKALPPDVCEILEKAPFLNGGLFKKNHLDELPIKISDGLFKRIFEFFEKYNFTIREDLPFEVEVAVDPQMIGYVYESLANVAQEIYDRNDLGIFYTPKIEVEFMCRRSLVEYLAKNLPEIPKEHIYRLLFDEDKEEVEKAITKLDAWRKIEEKLDSVTVVDPACGSGAFLVGMLNVLTEVYKLVYKNLNRNLSDFRIKKRIISRSLYGVDVMPWAIHAAELRLWLQLIVETDFSLEELRKTPLLPNLDMNLRIGDSLVQEIGGISFHVRANNLKTFLKNKLETLKQEKEKYVNNDPTCKFNSPQEIFEEEVNLYKEIIDDRIESLKTDNDTLAQSLRGKQKALFDEEPVKDKKWLQKEKEIQEKIAANEGEISILQQIRNELNKPEKKPFVWELDFAEIFSSDKQGFDIVIGNPPYVRQEMISPPNKLKSEVSLEDRRAYKNKLIQSVKKRFPQAKPPAARSDLYVYFYFHGLSLLNRRGTLCFISSNSWLDVGYGAELQEFLLRYVPIHAIYDNQAKRSFEHADVNTIISLFGAPEEGKNHFDSEGGQQAKNQALDNYARFVMFKKPFEEVLSAKNFLEIEAAKQIQKTPEYRVYPISQRDLLEDGWEYPENYDINKEGRLARGYYAGNKLGGKYLRAPDIFYTILEKGKGKLIKLGDIIEIRIGLITGANEFFYLKPTGKPASKGCLHVRNGASWEGEIEEEFLKPVIKSPRECDTILIDPKKLRYRLFMCNKSKSELKGTKALEYIEWGEKKGFNKRPSCASRNRWWELRNKKPWKILFTMYFFSSFKYHLNHQDVFIDCTMYEAKLKNSEDYDIFITLLNSSIWFFYPELFGRNYGAGAVGFKVYEIPKLYFINPNILKENKKIILKNIFNEFAKRKIHSVFTELGIDQNKPIREQEPNPLPDRKALDDIIFDALGLTKEERKEVYLAVCELVKQRIEKAKSLNKKEKKEG